MLKLPLVLISADWRLFEVRNTCLRLLWPETGPRTVLRYPVGSNFLGRTILQAAITKLINSYLASTFFLFPFLYDNLAAIRCIWAQFANVKNY